MLKEIFEDMARHTISKKLGPSEKTKSRWNLTSPGDYEFGRMLSAWQNFGVREFSRRYNHSTTNHEEVEILHIAEESILELREYFKTLD